MPTASRKSAKGKLSFSAGGAFIRETRQDVEAYLLSEAVLRRGRRQLYAKGVVAFVLFAASWLVLVLVRPGFSLDMVALAGLSLGTTLVGFCVQHDANHGAYFRTRRANHLLGWSTDVLLGFSSYAWRVKHNVAHHTYTNVDGYDDDVSQTPFARLLPTQTSRPWYRFQHVYIWSLYSFMIVRWQIGADIAALLRGRIGSSPLRPPRRWDLVGIVAGKLLFGAWAIAIPLVVYPWHVVLIGYLLFTMVTSVVTATTFQLAHCVEEADHSSLADLTAETREWARHEVETTVDFCPRNRVLTWLLGGLNYQIEHHLFPRVAHTHYAHIAEIVSRNAARHGIRYTVQPSLCAALRSHQRHLRTLGRNGIAVELEMG